MGKKIRNSDQKKNKKKKRERTTQEGGGGGVGGARSSASREVLDSTSRGQPGEVSLFVFPEFFEAPCKIQNGSKRKQKRPVTLLPGGDALFSRCSSTRVQLGRGRVCSFSVTSRCTPAPTRSETELLFLSLFSTPPYSCQRLCVYVALAILLR